jgi:hypothetical protein
MITVARVLVLATFLLCGCAMGFHPYPSASTFASGARLHAVRDPAEGASAGFRPAHWFFAYDNADCELNERGGFLGSISWDVGNEFNTALMAGERVYVRGIARFAEAGGGQISQIYCTTVTSFEPVPGGEYQVSQNGLSPDCPTNIVDARTGEPPATLRTEPIAKACGQFNGRNDG